MVEIFKCSLPKRKLSYKTFIGDGDSSSYPNGAKANPYPHHKIEKGESIGHVQKRVGKNCQKREKKLYFDEVN